METYKSLFLGPLYYRSDTFIGFITPSQTSLINTLGNFHHPQSCQDIKDISATRPLLLSIEAGERTKKVDYEGALKVFDAIEAVEGVKPRLILVSSLDMKDPEKIPVHYVSTSIHPRNSFPIFLYFFLT